LTIDEGGEKGFEGKKGYALSDLGEKWAEMSDGTRREGEGEAEEIPHWGGGRA